MRRRTVVRTASGIATNRTIPPRRGRDHGGRPYRAGGRETPPFRSKIRPSSPFYVEGPILPSNVNLVTGDAPGELVAREREYNLLGELRRNAASGRGGIALISGEAGIGKSALLRRFESGTGGGRSGSAFARCVEFIQTPLGPLRDLLQQVERSVSGPRDAAARGLIDRLAFEREADSQPAQPAGRLLESIDAAFARYAQRGTVVLLIEDVHWADQSTLKFLTYLADRIAARRMLVIATYRSDDVDGDQPRQAELAQLLAKQTVTQIALARLDERSTHALVEAELPHADAIDAATVADVVRRSRGNPFFAEELLKSALERTSGDGDQRLPLSNPGRGPRPRLPADCRRTQNFVAGRGTG